MIVSSAMKSLMVLCIIFGGGVMFLGQQGFCLNNIGSLSQASPAQKVASIPAVLASSQRDVDCVRIVLGVMIEKDQNFRTFLKVNNLSVDFVLPSGSHMRLEPIICEDEPHGNLTYISCTNITHSNLQYKTGPWWKAHFREGRYDWYFKIDWDIRLDFVFFDRMVTGLSQCSHPFVVGKLWPGHNFVSGALYGTNRPFPEYRVMEGYNDELTWSYNIPNSHLLVDLQLYYGGQGYRGPVGEECIYLVLHRAKALRTDWFHCSTQIPSFSCSGSHQSFLTWQNTTHKLSSPL